MRLFGLIGFPLSHSFSKKYFSEKFEQEKIEGCAYGLFPLGSIDELSVLLAAHPDLEGINVTIPYKEKVISFLHHSDDVVKSIGACNCIRIRNGLLHGFNTDVVGFEQTLLEKLRPHHQSALILGTGGASKAVAWVLRKLDIAYSIVSRTPESDEISYQQLTGDVIRKHPLIINTTPLGTYPAVDAAPPLAYEDLTTDHYLFDLVYNPAKTRFLQLGEQQGAAIANGQRMLEIQAEESWRIWNS